MLLGDAMKKYILMAFTLLLVIMISVVGLAEESERFMSGNYEYIILEDGTAEIVGSSESFVEELIIPENLNGYVVTSIGEKAFFCYRNLKSITLPESLTNIGDEAFQDCNYLTSITLPEKLTNIGDGAFWGCFDLESITLPESLTSIGDEAFYNCYNLTGITLPESLTNIGVGAFFGCFHLESINLPESLTSVGSGAFSGCGSIRFDVSPDHPYLATIDGVLFSKPDKRLISCPDTKNTYEVPDGIEVIGNRAFATCYNLTSVILPESVARIEEMAFIGCLHLTNVTLPESLTNIGDGAFCACTSISLDVATNHPYLEVIDKVLYSKPDKRLIFCSYTKDNCEVPIGTEIIGDRAFYICDNLTSITLPESVTSIGDEAFFNCENLTSITLPESVMSIGNYAFSRCHNLTSITLPESVTSIGDEAFSGCENLTSITLPKSVTSIGNYAFSYCDNLIVTVNRDSYAAKYCREKGLSYTYTDANDWLNS